MKHLHAVFAIASLCAAALASAADLTIEVSDVKSADGAVLVALYTADGFLTKPVTGTSAPATAGGMTLVLKDVPEGDYAFALFHDANGNGKMDRNMMGMPVEDYAFSNNALGKMGPPSYDSARIAVPAAGATVRVSLK